MPAPKSPPPIDEDRAALHLPSAMEIVAAERLEQHEKIVRLRALREAAGAEAMQGEKVREPGKE